MSIEYFGINRFARRLGPSIPRRLRSRCYSNPQPEFAQTPPRPLENRFERLVGMRRSTHRRYSRSDANAAQGTKLPTTGLLTNIKLKSLVCALIVKGLHVAIKRTWRDRAIARLASNGFTSRLQYNRSRGYIRCQASSMSLSSAIQRAIT